MNEKVGYLNLFFHRDKGITTPSLVEQVASQFPLLLIVCDTARCRIEYANEAFTEFTGCNATDTRTVDEILKEFIHPSDLPGLSQLLSSSRGSEPFQSSPFVVRLRGVQNDYRLFHVELRVLDHDLKVHLVLFIANDISQEVKSSEEIQTTRELLDETEELLQFGSWTWDIATNIVKWSPDFTHYLDINRKILKGR